MPPDAPRSPRDFTIAIICALSLEADAVHAVLDRYWDEEGHDYEQADGDSNSYTAGVIGEHNVIVIHLGGMGTTEASVAATNAGRSFPNITLALIVGICGGVPHGASSEQDVYLGDLIISTAAVRCDFGRQNPGGFERKNTLRDNLSRPSPRVRSVLSRLETKRYRRKMQQEMTTWLAEILINNPDMGYPGIESDRLFEPTLLHKHRQSTTICETCSTGPDEICDIATKASCQSLKCADAGQAVRKRDQSAGVEVGHPYQHVPEIHMGVVGSGNTVMRSGVHRDLFATRDSIIAFEMEGAGVWDQFPSIIMKGVCDYADSHKNKSWQKYAAAVAAAGMKSFLKTWAPQTNARLLVGTPKDAPSPIPTATGTTVFNNHGMVHSQIGTQTIHGSVSFSM